MSEINWKEWMVCLISLYMSEYIHLVNSDIVFTCLYRWLNLYPVTLVICQCGWAFAPWGQGGANQEEPIRAGVSLVPDIWRHLMKGAPKSWWREATLATIKQALHRAQGAAAAVVTTCWSAIRRWRHCSGITGRWNCGYGCSLIL